jgi:hypothetical protein
LHSAKPGPQAKLEQVSHEGKLFVLGGVLAAATVIAAILR